ncbi:MAG: hypothetical protein WCO67_18235 [Betaproteobacteria bacterium]
MPELRLPLKVRVYLAALAVLGLGMCAAVVVYVNSDEVPEAAIGYIVVDGMKYPIAAGDSKRYQRDLEMFGGKASVLFDEFTRWFARLWQGKTLGLTLAALSAVVALALFLFARVLPPD